MGAAVIGLVWANFGVLQLSLHPSGYISYVGPRGALAAWQTRPAHLGRRIHGLFSRIIAELKPVRFFFLFCVNLVSTLVLMDKRPRRATPFNLAFYMLNYFKLGLKSPSVRQNPLQAILSSTQPHQAWLRMIFS